MAFHVVGAGYPRTGTASLKAALEILYPGTRCYHMFELLKSETDVYAWVDRCRGGKMDWHKMLIAQGYSSGLDWPISLLYDEVMATFPGCKVILTQRDSPAVWAKSLQKFAKESDRLGGKFLNFFLPKFRALKELRTQGNMFEATFEELCEVYMKKNAEVKAKVPPHMLLVFNVKEGWEPLCRFLNKPVPEVPFPRLNDSSGLDGLFGGIILREVCTTLKKNQKFLLALLLCLLLFAYLFGHLLGF